VVFRFDKPVENHPDNPFGVDFTLFGNPLPNWSEPGIVSVMKDGNGNGLPDDTWYELAGSDYWFSSSRKDYQVTYTDPGGTGTANVLWEGGDGAAGFILANEAHDQPYFPLPDSFAHASSGTMVISAARIDGAVDVDHPPVMRSEKRAFGYADNRDRGIPPWNLPDNPYTPEPENAGGDVFDLDWAVDSAGNYVELDQVDFIRVHTAVLHQGSWLGEVSTEITGAVDVDPDPALEGPAELVVIRDLPPEIGTSSLQLEVLHFRSGRPVDHSQFLWSTDRTWASVADGHVLNLSGTGELSLTAVLEADPDISATVSTRVVDEWTGMRQTGLHRTALRVFPNPVTELLTIQLTGTPEGEIECSSISGQSIFKAKLDGSITEIDMSGIEKGVYFITIRTEDFTTTRKILRL